MFQASNTETKDSQTSVVQTKEMWSPPQEDAAGSIVTPEEAVPGSLTEQTVPVSNQVSTVASVRSVPKAKHSKTLSGRDIVVVAAAPEAVAQAEEGQKHQTPRQDMGVEGSSTVLHAVAQASGIVSPQGSGMVGQTGTMVGQHANTVGPGSDMVRLGANRIVQASRQAAPINPNMHRALLLDTHCDNSKVSSSDTVDDPENHVPSNTLQHLGASFYIRRLQSEPIHTEESHKLRSMLHSNLQADRGSTLHVTEREATQQQDVYDGPLTSEQPLVAAKVPNPSTLTQCSKTLPVNLSGLSGMSTDGTQIMVSRARTNFNLGG